MELLTGLTAALVLFAVVMVVIAVRRWNARERTSARVELLQALVEESARPVEPESLEVEIAPASRPAAPPAKANHPFVATVPDGGRSHQISFNAKTLVIVCLMSGSLGAFAQQSPPAGQGFSFRTGVELINVTATVTDAQGRFVYGLKADDFEVYEDGKLQTISQFDSERVPVSLGLAIDTSGSMAGEKMAAAKTAVNRFLDTLLGEQDEVFLFQFDSRVMQVSGWTEDRRSVGRMVGSLAANGGTAMYDAVAAAVPLAQKGTRRKKALLLISDGNDQNSQTGVDQVRQLIRESEVLVYAIGIDASGSSPSAYPSTARTSGGSSPADAGPRPSAFPGARIPASTATGAGSSGSSSASGSAASSGARVSSSARLNVDALRSITDDSGGRTEIIISARDLDPATASIAAELNRQYFIGYSTSSPRDGRWHTIEVRLKRGNYTIRARRGFTAG